MDLPLIEHVWLIPSIFRRTLDNLVASNLDKILQSTFKSEIGLYFFIDVGLFLSLQSEVIYEVFWEGDISQESKQMLKILTKISPKRWKNFK